MLLFSQTQSVYYFSSKFKETVLRIVSYFHSPMLVKPTCSYNTTNFTLAWCLVFLQGFFFGGGGVQNIKDQLVPKPFAQINVGKHVLSVVFHESIKTETCRT